MSRSHLGLNQLFLIMVFGLLLSACGGDGGGDGGPSAWLRIDSPVEGTSTGQNTVTVSGNAALYSGAYPTGSVTWSSAGYSGATDLRVTCLIACIGAFETDIPLSLGVNTITVTFMDGSDSVTISRYPLEAVGGRVVMNGTGAGVPDLQITLSGATSRSTRTNDNGEYAFTYVQSGTYSITPSLSVPQSSTCLSFVPSSRTIEVTTTDVLGQDFTSTQVSPCYSISGRITPSTNPTFGMPDIEVTLTDAHGVKLVHLTDESGMYFFHHLAAGIYTVTPSDCFWLDCAAFTPSSRTITITNGDVIGQDFLRQF
jgi:hypothetical protein